MTRVTVIIRSGKSRKYLASHFVEINSVENYKKFYENLYRNVLKCVRPTTEISFEVVNKEEYNHSCLIWVGNGFHEIRGGEIVR